VETQNLVSCAIWVFINKMEFAKRAAMKNIIQKLNQEAV